MTQQAPSSGSVVDKFYMTLAGLPLSIRLDWPFHRSTSGADFFVLHTDIRVENTNGLHALVSVNMTQTVRQVLPSLEAADAEAPVLNALRKEVDSYQIEFMKSAKLIPMPFSSRHYDVKRSRWSFHHVDDAQIAEFLRRKVYWEQKLGSAAGKSWLADPVDALYLGTSPEHMLEVARGLSDLIRLEGDHGRAAEALLSQSDSIEGEMRHALEALEQKHAFERG